MGGRLGGGFQLDLSQMKIALVHDYIKEFGGAERVLRVLSDIYPEAPIYTAFQTPDSTAAKEFSDRKIVESPFAFLLRYGNMHSPMRFLLPWIWKSIDLSKYDLVITSCSGYLARGFKVSDKTKVIAYCHTPPRFLYGYQTNVDLQKYWPVRVYAAIVGHYLRMFDFESAQRVDKWIVNSKNVAARVAKFYRKEATVIYPPIEIKLFEEAAAEARKDDYFLIVSRLVGAKGLLEAVKAAKHLNIRIKIAGGSVGHSVVKEEMEKIKGDGVEVLGRVGDEELRYLYARAKGFVALAREEDFGMAVVESMAAGTPVIAFNGGGFRETVVDGETGILIDDIDVPTLEKAFKRFEEIKWDKEKIQKQARKFSRENFEDKFSSVINKLS